MIYSKGVAGEVTVDGTVSDPVACPSLARRSFDGLLSEFGEARGGSGRGLITPVRLLRAVVNRPCRWTLFALSRFLVATMDNDTSPCQT